MPRTSPHRNRAPVGQSEPSSMKLPILRFKFSGIPSQPDRREFSEILADNDGNKWRLMMSYSATDAENNAVDDPWMKIFLVYMNNYLEHGITARCTFIVRNALGGVYGEKHLGVQTFKAKEKESWGGSVARRSQLLDEENNILVDGALLVDVHLQVKKQEIFIPTNPFGANMLKLLDDEEDTDVSFMVKKTTIRAHKILLKLNAPILYGFCEENKKGKSIPIKETTPKIFRVILRYVYGGSLPDSVTIDTGKELIIAADRYGVPGLKLAVETTLVQALMLDNDNFADWLMFADSMALPLLKEHAVSYFVARATDLINSGHMATLNQSPKLMNELMVEVSTSLTNDSRFNNTGRNMSVNELRKTLDKQGLDVDGSKEMLISRYQENKRQRTS